MKEEARRKNVYILNYFLRLLKRTEFGTCADAIHILRGGGGGRSWAGWGRSL